MRIPSPPLQQSRRQIQKQREQEHCRQQRERRRYLQRMRPRFKAELDITIAHIRRVRCSDELLADLDATLEWLEDAHETLRHCRDEGMNDPAASIYALRALRRKWPLAHGSSRDEEGRMDDIADCAVPGVPDEERHLGPRQSISKSTEHEPGEPRIPSSERGEAASKRRRRYAELIELERYRDQTVDGRLQAVGGVLRREGVEMLHDAKVYDPDSYTKSQKTSCIGYVTKVDVKRRLERISNIMAALPSALECALIACEDALSLLPC